MWVAHLHLKELLSFAHTSQVGNGLLDHCAKYTELIAGLLDRRAGMLRPRRSFFGSVLFPLVLNLLDLGNYTLVFLKNLLLQGWCLLLHDGGTLVELLHKG